MSDFWERQRAKQQAQITVAAPQPSDDSSIPYWARGTTLIPGNQAVSQNQPQGPVGPDGTEGHDFSQAHHLKNQADCPNCYSGNYMKVGSSARRCFDCGHVEGREIHDPSTEAVQMARVSGPAQRSQQVSSIQVLDGTGKPTGTVTQVGNQGNITSATQAFARLG